MFVGRVARRRLGSDLAEDAVVALLAFVPEVVFAVHDDVDAGRQQLRDAEGVAKLQVGVGDAHGGRPSSASEHDGAGDGAAVRMPHAVDRPGSLEHGVGAVDDDHAVAHTRIANAQIGDDFAMLVRHPQTVLLEGDADGVRHLALHAREHVVDGRRGAEREVVHALSFAVVLAEASSGVDDVHSGSPYRCGCSPDVTELNRMRGVKYVCSGKEHASCGTMA